MPSETKGPKRVRIIVEDADTGERLAEAEGEQLAMATETGTFGQPGALRVAGHVTVVAVWSAMAGWEPDFRELVSRWKS